MIIILYEQAKWFCSIEDCLLENHYAVFKLTCLPLEGWFTPDKQFILTYHYSKRLWSKVPVLFQLSSVHSVQSLNRVWIFRPQGLQHTSPPCASPTPEVHPNSRPSSRWCHPAISSSVVLFSVCPQFLSASESFPMSQLFSWGGQSIGVSALASVFPKNTQGRSPLEWTSWISMQSKGLTRVFSDTAFQKYQFFGA